MKILIGCIVIILLGCNREPKYNPTSRVQFLIDSVYERGDGIVNVPNGIYIDSTGNGDWVKVPTDTIYIHDTIYMSRVTIQKTYNGKDTFFIKDVWINPNQNK